jgi:hypothetical protein
VCSTTLWVGHLSRLVQEDELSDIFGTYGEVSPVHFLIRNNSPNILLFMNFGTLVYFEEVVIEEKT